MEISLFGIACVVVSVEALVFHPSHSRLLKSVAVRLFRVRPSRRTYLINLIAGGSCGITFGMLLLVGLLGPGKSEMNAEDWALVGTIMPPFLILIGIQSLVMRRSRVCAAAERGDSIFGRTVSKCTYEKIATITGLIPLIVGLLSLAGVLPYRL